MNNKCGSVPCGARILGRAATVGCARACLPRGHTVGWVPLQPRSTTDQREHLDVSLIWSD